MSPVSPKPDNGALPRHVLLVEDDPILALDIIDTLKAAGVAEVQHRITTDEALIALREATPDVVILDVHLADRDDGWAIAELVRTLLPHPPRIIFSTGAPEAIPEEIAEMGPVLEKPYDGADLVALIREPIKRGIFSRLKGVIR